MPKRRSLRLVEKKKRREEEVKGQEVEEREVKRSRVDGGSSETTTCALDFNPFLVEPILRKLLKKVDTVVQLKDLRKMCLLWDNVNIEELEERAFKGKLKAIDFKWTDRFKTKNEAVKEFLEFLEDTRSIPRLFHSFKFNIPEFLKVLPDHTSAFFSDYQIYGVELLTSGQTDFNKFQAGTKYLLSLIGSNLKDIKISEPNGQRHASFAPKSLNWPIPEQELVLPKLEKLAIENSRWDTQLTEFFKSILGTGSGHITSLMLTSLPGADIGSFPGLDLSRMTRLDIGGDRGGFEGTSMALKYTTGLLTLVEKGMKLKDLGLKFYASRDDTSASFVQDLPTFCSNMTHFFATQSSTLTTLDIKLKFITVWPGSEDEIEAEIAKYGKIQLPIFQALHTLSIEHRLRIDPNRKNNVFSLFEAKHSLPLHFPSLVNLTFDCECSMGLFFDPPGQMGLAGDSRFHFKRLEIMEDCMDDRRNSEARGNWKMLYEALIESVDYLKIPSGFFKQARIPWADSLRQLRIEYVKEPLKLAHLKKLETLTIVGNRRRIGYEEISWGSSSEQDSDSDDESQESVFDYLSLFREAIGLSLTYIKFIGLKMEEMEEEEIKEEFIQYFPFPVKFEETDEEGIKEEFIQYFPFAFLFGDD